MIEPLRSVLAGEVVTPDDPTWDAVRPAWNLIADQQPLAIVLAADASDVEQTVAFAAAHGLKVSAQAGGHGATKALNGTVVLRTNALDDIWIDSEARIARVGAGVRWGALQSALNGTGLTGLPGSCEGVSVVGYCTSGGLSWFARPYGSGAGSLRAVELVDAGGLRRWVDDTTDPDLMWAIRGGGGNFGIITSVEVELFSAPEITGGRLMFPISEAEAVLTAYGEATASAADHVTLWAYLTHFPALPAVPEPVRGRSFCMIDAITPYRPAALQAALEPIRAAGTPVVDTIRAHEPGSLGEITPGAGDPMSVLLASATFDAVNPELIGRLLKYVVPPIFQVQIRHLRASDEVGHAGVAAADPAAQYCALVWAPTPAPEYEVPAREALAAFVSALAPWQAGDLPPTSLGDGDELADVLSAADLARLKEIKQRVDPLGVLTGNFSL